MDGLRRISRRAVRRETLRRFVRAAGLCLSVAMGAALVLLLIDKLVGPGVPWWLILGVAGGAAIGVAVVIATVVHRVSPVEATGEVDSALGLKDRLSSALALSERNPDDPFVGIAVEEASALAGRVRVRQAIPVKGDHWWWTWPVIAAAALGVGIFVPQLRLLTDQDAERAALQRIAQREAAASDLDETTRALDEALRSEDGLNVADPATSEKLSRLEELRDQLTSGEKDADEARGEAAGVLSDLADRFEQEARRKELETQAVREMYEKLGDTESGEPDDAVDRLIDALSRSDPEAVDRAVEDLRSKLEGMTPEERRAAAERLEDLASRLDELSKQAEEQAEKRREAAEEKLREHGLPEADAQSLAEKTKEEELERELRDRGLDEESARRLSEQIAEENRRREAEQRASERARETSEAMDEAAQETREPTPPEEREQSENQGQQNGPQGEQRERQGDEANRQERQRQERGTEGEREPRQREGESGKPKEGQEGQEGNEGQDPGSQTRQIGPEAQQGQESKSEGESSNAPEGTHQGEESSSQGKPQEGQESTARPEQGESGEQGSEPREQQTQEGSKGQEQSRGGSPDSRSGEENRPQPGEGQGESATPQQGSGDQEPGDRPEVPDTSREERGQGTGGDEPREERGAAPGEQPSEQEALRESENGERQGVTDEEQRMGEGGGGAGAGDRDREHLGSDENQSPEKGLDRLRKQMEEMRRRGEDAEQDRARSEEAERRAKELIEKMSPEQREELRRWAADQMRERQGERTPTDPGEYKTDLVDARGEGAGDAAGGKVVGEVEAEDGAPPPDSSTVSHEEAIEALSGSLESTERAMDDRVVPSRYTNVQRYFQQALERLKRERAEAAAKGGDEGGGEVVPAQDVDSGKTSKSE